MTDMVIITAESIYCIISRKKINRSGKSQGIFSSLVCGNPNSMGITVSFADRKSGVRNPLRIVQEELRKLTFSEFGGLSPLWGHTACIAPTKLMRCYSVFSAFRV